MSPLTTENCAAVFGRAVETPVPILQHKAEFDGLLALYQQERPSRTLEVGTYHGGSLFHWLQHSPAGGLVVSVDSYAAGVDNRHLYSGWTPPGVTLDVIAGDSRDPWTIGRVRHWAPYDFAFIDAGHYYPEVLADWETYAALVRPGGLVAFHDILTHPAHPEIEVGRLWAEIRDGGYDTSEIVAYPDAEWGGIGVVRVK